MSIKLGCTEKNALQNLFGEIKKKSSFKARKDRVTFYFAAMHRIIKPILINRNG